MAFHDIQMESITGEQIDFAQFEGEFVPVSYTHLTLPTIYSV